MIKLRNVSKHYRLGDNIVKAVDKANLNVAKGDFSLIIGRSGSGKTTLLCMLNGLTKPTSGTVYVDGTNIWEISEKERSLIRSNKIGFIFQFPSLIPTLTTLDNVMLPAMFNKTKSNVYNRAVKLLNILGLGHRINAYPSQLSIGQQKRVAVARALVNKPQILLADEPTADLDVETEKEVMQFLCKMSEEEKLTVIMVTHHLELTEYASRVFSISSGTVKEVNKEEEKLIQ
jgi:ABC-type lipoprotein export system ATPase subunit